MSWRKLTQNGFYVHNFAFDNGFERVNIATVDTDVPILKCIFSPCSMGKFVFNMEHHQQRRCMTCLKIHWIEVLLVVATQLAVSKEKVL